MRYLAIAVLLGLNACADPTFLHEVVSVPRGPQLRQDFVVREIVRGQADILWVIDNSGSMGTYQRAVSDNTAAFIQEFTATAQLVDWKMGLLSTDTRDAPYVGFQTGDELNVGSPDAVLRFQSAVRNLGIDGDPSEKFFDPVTNAVNANPGFLRHGAKLFLIVVSDEEEQSNQGASQFVSALTAKLRDPSDLSTYGVLSDQDQDCGSADYVGERYELFLNLTRGKFFPICSDFGVSLAAIARDMGQQIEAPRLDLERRPVLSTLKVYYQDQLLPGGPKDQGGYWTYHLKLNAVIFHDLRFATGDLETVHVEFQAQR